MLHHLLLFIDVIFAAISNSGFMMIDGVGKFMEWFSSLIGKTDQCYLVMHGLRTQTKLSLRSTYFVFWHGFLLVGFIEADSAVSLPSRRGCT